MPIHIKAEIIANLIEFHVWCKVQTEMECRIKQQTLSVLT